MAKKAAKQVKPKALAKKLNLPNDEPLHVDMSPDELLKMALNTPIKKSKVKK